MKKKQVIMVMGVQRSGTTALFRSLAQDAALTSYNESADDRLYYLYRLRPITEIARILDAAPGAVLLKPITETFHRSLEDLVAEFANYAVRFVWMYRDPVNVLHSMLRKHWLPHGLEGKRGAGSWVARNQGALRFQECHPAKIAVVRYEDLIADANVFSGLCRSLGINGRPLFRKDSGAGRIDLPPETQRAIDAVTGETVRALDAARTFKPGRLQRWKVAATARLSRPPKQSASASASARLREWENGVAAAPRIQPSELDDVVFWLDPERLSTVEGRIQQANEVGPLRLRAMADSQPPFCIPFLNGCSAVFFPTSKALERNNGDPGTLRFIAPESEACPATRNSWSLFTLIKPHIPTARDLAEAHPKQKRTVALRIKSYGGPAEFVLEWDRDLRASKATLRTLNQKCYLTTEPGSHPHQQWRLVCFQRQERNDSQLLLSVDGVDSVESLPETSELLQTTNPSGWTIELGGSEADPDALFYGAVAEVIVFGRSLNNKERFGVARYLKQKYKL